MVLIIDWSTCLTPLVIDARLRVPLRALMNQNVRGRQSTASLLCKVTQRLLDHWTSEVNAEAAETRGSQSSTAATKHFPQRRKGAKITSRLFSFSLCSFAPLRENILTKTRTCELATQAGRRENWQSPNSLILLRYQSRPRSRSFHAG
jgi:hypothetical protein